MLSHKITTSRNCILGLLLGFFSLNTFAGNLNLELPATDLTLPALKKSYDIQLGIQDEKYSATPTELNGYNNFTDAKLRAKGQTLWSASRAYIDVGGTYSANISSFGTVYVPEAFYSYSGSSFEMTLGRRLFAWNELDSYWQLGLWQTSFKWNYVQPVEQGLTGLYFDLHSTEFKFLVFASPLFIPEQSAPFSLSNGQINSQSPWFTPPAKYVQLFSGRANINYNLMTPPTSSIVSQCLG